MPHRLTSAPYNKSRFSFDSLLQFPFSSFFSAELVRAKTFCSFRFQVFLDGFSDNMQHVFKPVNIGLKQSNPEPL
jgi:hypothetical protein